MVDLVGSGQWPEEQSREFEPPAQPIRNCVRQADREQGDRPLGLTGRSRASLSLGYD